MRLWESFSCIPPVVSSPNSSTALTALIPTVNATHFEKRAILSAHITALNGDHGAGGECNRAPQDPRGYH